MSLFGALQSAARLPSTLGAAGARALEELNPGRRSRRAFSTESRTHIEVRGADVPGHEQMAEELRSALMRLEGVVWAEVNGVTGRVVVGHDPGRPSQQELVEVVERVERLHHVDKERFSNVKPEHPADVEPLRRAALALAADAVGLSVSTVTQLLRATPVPVELAAALSFAEQQPRVRELLERALGAPGADLGLALGSAFAQAVSQGPLGLAVDFGHRAQQLSELHERREAWKRLEPVICSPEEAASRALEPAERPRRLHRGALERGADGMTLASFGAAAAALATTGSLRRSAGLMVAGLPKAARVGRESFSAAVGRELARRDVLILDQGALRRLDRIDTVVLDALAVLEPPAPGVVVTLGESKDRIRAVVGDVFDPAAPSEVVRHGAFTIGPVPALRRLGIELAPELLRARGKPAAAAGRLAVARDGRAVAVVLLETALDPLARALASRAATAGLEVVVAGGPRWLARQIGAERRVAGGARLARSVRELQADGSGVLLVSVRRHDQALSISDCAVGVRTAADRVAWAADLVCLDGLRGVQLVIDATSAARPLSTRCAQLAAAGAVAGGLFCFAGPARTSARRAAVAVNASAVFAQLQALVSARAVTSRPPPSIEMERRWHEMEPDAVLTALAVGPAGLRPDQVDERRTAPDRPPPAIARLSRAVAAELANPLTPLLGAGTALSAAAGSLTDAGLVAGVLGANALIGGLQRLRAETSIERLLAVTNDPVLVRRVDGPELVARAEVVQGDLLDLAAGQVVPADCRICEAEGCEVDESVLTGESLPVPKASAVTPGAEVAERSCMLYEGTTVLSGRALAVVVAAGQATEVARSLLDAPEPPPSGVEARLSSLTAQTIPVTVAGGLAVTGIGLVRSRSPRRAISSGVSLTVAAVPEGLPILASTAQYAAARRLSGKGALVRHPRTIEALGRVDTLCFDKTGTLTLGELRLRRVFDGDVDEPAESLGRRRRAVLAAALRATPSPGGDGGHLVLNGTDRSVVEGASREGVSPAEGLADWLPTGHLPFDSARGFRAVVGATGDGFLLVVKGAPEAILPRCTHWRGPAGLEVVDEGLDRRFRRAVGEMAGRGLRVLAVAERACSGFASLGEERVADLELVGFVGLADSVRPTAAQAVADLRAAGIEVVMITGDHPGTAVAIAEELGIANGHLVMTGRELESLPDEQLDRLLPEISVFARVTPRHKVRIVSAYQRLGRTVAMTGDGANDAAAIRLADAGLALGDRSSGAAREAADLVVTDNRIETILEAVVEGRALWISVRDALSILLGGNLGEIGFTLAATALAGTSPLRVRQLLLVNLLTDMLPAMTIAVRPPASLPMEVLRHEGPDTSLGASLTRQMAIRAATTAGGALTAWTLARATGTAERASSVALVALVGTQLGQTALVGWRSPIVLASAAGSAVALTAIVQTPGVSHFFGCRPLGPIGWTIAGGSSFAATAATTLITGWVARRSSEPAGLPGAGGRAALFTGVVEAPGAGEGSICAESSLVSTPG